MNIVRPGDPCRLLLATLLAAATFVGAVHAGDDEFAAARARMVREIADTQQWAAGETGIQRFAKRTMDVMAATPRHQFVREQDLDEAYENRPLPIGHGQTISQPYIVALMTDLLALQPGQRVFELGTGSGYQAAILGALGAEVYSVEIVEPLGKEAGARLERLGYGSVHVKVADGYYGWPEHAPFDAIVVTAAASHVPPPLVEQLKPGGRMVIPVGTSFLMQHLLLVEKDAEGGVSTRQILPVSFVPVTGGH
jgi:protein-L-isoaspartate(D-aspartate) O-methyltransferase